MLAVSDALAIAVMEKRAFGKEDFAKFHPSGTLGKRLLLRVSDAMRPFDEIAIVSPEKTILDVMAEITKAGVGAACIVDDQRGLLGLISDGDLRRHIVSSPHRLEVAAGEIMNQGASTIGPDLLAVEALEIFQNLPRKLGDLPVVKDGKVVGLLLLKDLLRIGIV
jgi:arabinose-5-phosphate isomerase